MKPDMPAFPVPLTTTKIANIVMEKEIIKRIIVKGKPVNIKLTYERCKLYYSNEQKKFLYQPYNLTKDCWEGDVSRKDWTLLGARETTFDVAQSFTNVIDALKLMFGSNEFTLARIQALWNAHRGKTDLFEIDKPALFFPLSK